MHAVSISRARPLSLRWSALTYVGLLDGASFGPEHYTRDTIVNHLQRYAYYGLAAVLSAGTDVGPLSFELRNAPPPDAARLLTAGRGMAAPDGGPGIPSIANTSFPVTTADEGRQRVRELAAQGANAVKIWVDDRNGTGSRNSRPRSMVPSSTRRTSTA